MKKLLAIWCLLSPFLLLQSPPLPADVAAVSSKVEYERFMEKIVSLIALREELAASSEDDKLRGESGRVLSEIGRIEYELNVLGVDWQSFLAPAGRCGSAPFLKNTFIHPAIQFGNLPRHLRRLAGKPKRASDVSADGEVLDSAFFINRNIDAFVPQDIAQIDALNRPRGKITLLSEEVGGKAGGFLGADEEGTPFIFKLDPPGMEEQVTGAEVIGSTIARLMGYNVPVSTIVTIEGTGNDSLDGRRAAATKLVPGAIGSWSYYAFRNRREIRASCILAAWINNTGWVDHNTLISSFKVGNVELYRYYICSFESSLGSAGTRTKLPRDGWQHSFDCGIIASTPFRLVLKPFGLWRVRYSRNARPIDRVVGLFDANVNPDLYEAQYPNMAWRYMTTEDALWAVNLISRFTPAQIEAIVDLARYSNPGDAEYIKNILLERQRKIVEHYLRKEVK